MLLIVEKDNNAVRRREGEAFSQVAGRRDDANRLRFDTRTLNPTR